MIPRSRTSQVCFAGIAFTAAVVVAGYFGFWRDGAMNSSPAGAPSSAVQSEMPRAHGTAAMATAVAITPAQLTALVTVPRPQPVVPAAIQQLLPSVQGAVANWKEFKPQKITIAPYPDMPIEFEATSIREESGRTVWTGRNAALPGAFLVAAATENDWQATLVIPPAGAFDIHIDGRRVTMLEKNRDEDLCGTHREMSPGAAADLTRPAQEPAVAAAIVAEADSTTTVDVLFFYDADTLAQMQNKPANFETRMIAYLASSNAALVNSGITNFRWRYLAAYQVPAYTATSDMTDDLYLIAGRSRTQNVAAPNPVNDFVTQKAVLHGADQVVLYVGGNRNFGGIAWRLSGSDLALQPLIYHSSVVATNSSYLALAHELAHNFGCDHDRDTASAVDGDGLFYYGYRFLDRSGRDTGTIMSYAIFQLPYYSTPTITFDGYVLGVAETLPRAANNSRVLREAAPTMIASRIAVDPPAIILQPQSVTITVGRPFALGVSATGQSLTYQWKMAGVDISGATGSAYSKSAATGADAGSYTVTISNIAGQANSTAAIVTVTESTAGSDLATTTPVTPPAPSSGGGGGGGAPSLWFYGMMSLLVAIRFIARPQESA